MNGLPRNRGTSKSFLSLLLAIRLRFLAQLAAPIGSVNSG